MAVISRNYAAPWVFTIPYHYTHRFMMVYCQLLEAYTSSSQRVTVIAVQMKTAADSQLGGMQTHLLGEFSGSV